MKLTLLGTGSPIPDPNRAGPSTLLQAGGSAVVVDCGRGLCMRLMGAGCPPAFVGAVLLTHLHSDHICDLNDLVTSRWITQPAAAALPIYGPVGTAAMVEAMLAMLAPDESYRLDHHDDLRAAGGMAVSVVEVSPGDVFRIGEVQVSVHRTDHRPVHPTVGYRVEHDGRSAALAGDTVPCDELDAMCASVDVYVQTVIREDQVRALSTVVPTASRLLDILDYHSTVEQAAQTAARCGVGRLMLTHFVPPPPPGAEEEWKSIAAAHFGGEIIAGPDLTSIEW